MRYVDFIVQYLKEQEKVSHVFTYAGGTSAWLLDVLDKTDGISYIAMRHEQNAAFAADGYARAGERLGVALTMSGPGATNLITGIADAFFDSVPVLFLTSEVTVPTYKFGLPVRQLGYQETDIVSLVRSITKHASLVLSENEMRTMLQKGIAIAKADRPGPVLLDIPSDIQRREITHNQQWSGPTITNECVASDKEIASVLKLIKEASRPVVLVGGGIRTSKTSSLLKEFINRFHIPVAVSLMGKDSFPNDHPLYVGFIGSYGNRFANLALANSDLVIALGSRLDSRQTANPKTFARVAKKAHIDIDQNELNNTIASDLSIHSGLKGFFEKILLASESIGLKKYDKWLEYIKEVKREFDVDTMDSDKNVNPRGFLRQVSSFSSGNEIFVADVGNNQMWAAQELKIKDNQRFLTSGGLGTMGFSIPAGIGAYFACPDRPVICIVGDGGFQMSIPEIQTIVHNNIPIKIIIMNNSVLGLMWHFQNENFKGGHPATEDGYSCPDIQKLAAAYGIPSIQLADNLKTKDALSWLFSIDGPALLEVVIDRAWTGYPKIKPGRPLEEQIPELPKKKLKRYMLIPTLE